MTACSLRSGLVEGAKPGGTGAVEVTGTAAGFGAAAGATATGVAGAAGAAGVAALGEGAAGGALPSPPQPASTVKKIPNDPLINI